MAAFELSFSIRKELKKVSEEIAFALISLFHVQTEEPASRSTTARAFVFLAKFSEFYYHKIFKQGVDDNLSVCVDEHNLCGLSVT